MKKYYYILFSFFIGVLILYTNKVEANMPLLGKTIIIDPGHGGVDAGTNYQNIYEKNINLSISKHLNDMLTSIGANVIMTRDSDYDLSKPKATYRKKSDFDNRIKLINESDADLYLSIHLNYLSDSRYYGPQVFYNKDNEYLANIIQNEMNKKLNGDRKIKKIPHNTYMYHRLNKNGVLIECGFLSNYKEREKLKTYDYQKEIANAISLGVLKYFQYQSF